MSWSDKYIGIPHMLHGASRDGCDCWGLVRLVYLEQHAITLPAYHGASASREEIVEVHKLVAGEKNNGPWLPVPPIQNDRLQPFDVLTFRRGRLDAHVALVVDNRLMLHIAENDVARLENFRAGRWASRLTGSYRHGEVAP